MEDEFLNPYKTDTALLCEAQLSLRTSEFFIGWQSGTN